jgi:hypothetical protein
MRDQTSLRLWDDQIKEMENKVERAKIEHPIRIPPRQQRVHGLGDSGPYYPGDRNPR